MVRLTRLEGPSAAARQARGLSAAARQARGKSTAARHAIFYFLLFRDLIFPEFFLFLNFHIFDL